MLFTYSPKSVAINHITILRYQSGTVHSGHLALEDALVKMESTDAVISGIINLEGALGIRVYETCGKETKVAITCSKEIASAELVDLSGRTLQSDIHYSQCALCFTMKSYSLGMVKIIFK